MQQQARLLVLDGSLGGRRGETARVAERALAILRRQAAVEVCTLLDEPDVESVLPRVMAADAFLFATGA